jgi:predicted nuclease of predicted toxin-antitoxin system
MNVLLDECLPRKLALLLPGHDVLTVPQAGWAGLKNGKLLAVAKDQFDVFITVDQNLTAQQNHTKLDLAIVVLKSISNELGHLRPLVPCINEVLSKPNLVGVHYCPKA